MSGERWWSEVWGIELLVDHIYVAIKEFPEELRPLVLTYVHIMESIHEVAHTMNYYVSGDSGEDTLMEVMQQELDKIEKAIQEYREEYE